MIEKRREGGKEKRKGVSKNKTTQKQKQKNHYTPQQKQKTQKKKHDTNHCYLLKVFQK